MKGHQLLKAVQTFLAIVILSTIFSSVLQAQMPGAFYWGEGDGNGIIDGTDYNILLTVYKDSGVDDNALYTGYPTSRYRQDLSGNGIIDGPDVTNLVEWVRGNYTGNTIGEPKTITLENNTLTVAYGSSVVVSALAYS